MKKNSGGILRPTSLRGSGLCRSGTAALLGVTAATFAVPALAQEVEDDEEIQLETLQIEDRAADVNPYTSQGAPYKARVSADPRRVKPLAETPATITVITETQMEEAGTTDLKEVLRLQPGVTIGTGENGNAFGDRYIIRGEEARSDVFVDGLRDPGMTTRESFAVDQVEITKGPSSTFAGRGASGGAVNAITKSASTDYSFHKVDLGVGTDSFWRGTLDTNWALGENVAVRANLLYANQDVPDRDPAYRERWGAAVSGLVRVSEDVRVQLDYYHLTAKDRPDLGVYVAASDAEGYGKTFDDLPSYAQDEDFLKSDVDTVTGRIFITPMDGFEIVNSTRYGESHNGYVATGARGDSTGGSISLSTHQGWQDVNYFVNQLNVIGRFETAGLAHNLIVGSEYSDHKVRNGAYETTTQGATNCEVAGRGGVRPAYCITDANGEQIIEDGAIRGLLQRDITKGSWDSLWHMRTLSFYAMDTVDVTPWLSLNGGVRADAIDFALSTYSASSDSRSDYYINDTLWNGHAGVSLKPMEELMLYFTWSTGSNVNGGESDLGSNCGYGGLCVDQNVPLSAGKPESSESFEVGAKWDLFDDRLLLTVAAFQTTKDDVYETAGGGSGYTPSGSLNTGKTRVKGIEIGLVGNITDRLSAQIGGSIMDAKVLDSYSDANIGLTLANFADNQVTGQVRYQVTDAFAFGVTGTYKSAMYAGQPDAAASYNAQIGRYTFRVPSSTVFDAFAEYKFNTNFSARINVQNIGNEDFYTAAYRSGAFLYKGDERRGTITLTGRF
ncbi:TonB-dependent siderophore receptor [Novosphingobium sp. BW1]|uniref:TonB-dependent receptor n=1 Tax=Novosphingobium sp. BW1 TaxID=2592621 RepID=UPI0011DEAAD0|nr:TonB-dependent receptor [Novosphingobium sp. BW1]TYC90952.1 TonB-dependent siderophore receptor [Novosphingobium sp. BW1]